MAESIISFDGSGFGWRINQSGAGLIATNSAFPLEIQSIKMDTFTSSQIGQGTPQTGLQLPSFVNPLGLTIKASSTNSGLIFIGSALAMSGVTYALDPGDVIDIDDFTNLNLLFIDSVISGDKIYLFGGRKA